MQNLYHEIAQYNPLTPKEKRHFVQIQDYKLNVYV